MPIQWDRVMVEFNQMKEFDQLRAVTREQMAWLTEVAGKVACKQALDLGFGCGFSAVVMLRGGCCVTCVNNEAAKVGFWRSTIPIMARSERLRIGSFRILATPGSRIRF